MFCFLLYNNESISDSSFLILSILILKTSFWTLGVARRHSEPRWVGFFYVQGLLIFAPFFSLACNECLKTIFRTFQDIVNWKWACTTRWKLINIRKFLLQGVTHVICCTGTTAFPSRRWDGDNTPERVGQNVLSKILILMSACIQFPCTFCPPMRILNWASPSYHKGLSKT